MLISFYHSWDIYQLIPKPSYLPSIKYNIHKIKQWSIWLNRIAKFVIQFSF